MRVWLGCDIGSTLLLPKVMLVNLRSGVERYINKQLLGSGLFGGGVNLISRGAKEFPLTRRGPRSWVPPLTSGQGS
jgi:hypothetical protein